MLWLEPENVFKARGLDPDKWQIQCVRDSLSSIESMLLLCARQCGKALAIDTPIMTSEGWTMMGEIKAGDSVFDELGEMQEVLTCSEVESRECYRVGFSDGSNIDADAEHLWVTVGTKHAGSGPEWWQGRRPITTLEMLDAGGSHVIPPPHKRSVAVTGIRPIGKRPVKCIAVTGPSRLYLAGESMIPTHNSETDSAIALLTVLLTPPALILFLSKASRQAEELLHY
jgi:replicative DNA helicase